MALPKLYTVKEVAAYFGVAEATVHRWIKEYRDTNGEKGLKAELINGKYKSTEEWVKEYAHVLFPTSNEKASA